MELSFIGSHQIFGSPPKLKGISETDLGEFHRCSARKYPWQSVHQSNRRIYPFCSQFVPSSFPGYDPKRKTMIERKVHGVRFPSCFDVLKFEKGRGLFAAFVSRVKIRL